MGITMSKPEQSVVKHCLRCDSLGVQARTMEDEKIEIFALDMLPDKLCEKVSWLIPLALSGETLTAHYYHD